MIINKAYIKIENRKYISSIEEIFLNYLQNVEISFDENIATIATIDNEAFNLQLSKIYHLISLDLNTNISVLIVPFFDDIFKKYLNFINNEVCTAFEVFLRNVNDENVKNDSKKILESINKKDLDTIKAFLMCNANSCVTANELYLHRNSFNYRMNGFVNNSSMDVRDLNTLMFIQLILGINK